MLCHQSIAKVSAIRLHKSITQNGTAKQNKSLSYTHGGENLLKYPPLRILSIISTTKLTCYLFSSNRFLYLDSPPNTFSLPTPEIKQQIVAHIEINKNNKLSSLYETSIHKQFVLNAVIRHVYDTLAPSGTHTRILLSLNRYSMVHYGTVSH